jgi:ribosomal subunit interface protein
MQVPLQIEFQNMDRSDAVEARIRERADKLERFFPRIIGCRVTVVAPHRHHRHGKLYAVNIDLDVPGRHILVNHAGPKNHAHEDVYVAMRDAFDAVQRQLEDHSRKFQQKEKHHEGPLHGAILRLFPYEGYGFVELPDGQEIYFHRNSVVDDNFDRLEVGREVRLEIAEGESANGPQASTVHLVGKHRLTG